MKWKKHTWFSGKKVFTIATPSATNLQNDTILFFCCQKALFITFLEHPVCDMQLKPGGRVSCQSMRCNMQQMYLPSMKSVNLPVYEIIAIEVWGGGETQSWGRGGRRRSGMVQFERGLMTSYRHSIVTFPLSLPVFVRQFANFPHPTSGLPKSSPCSPGSRWIAFGVQRAKVLG